MKYKIATVTRTGKERLHQYATDHELQPSDVVVLEGRHWLVYRVEKAATDTPARAFAKLARYRLVLKHPDGREEAGAFRRFRPDAPRLGHAFTTLEGRQPVSWEVSDQRLALD